MATATLSRRLSPKQADLLARGLELIRFVTPDALVEAKCPICDGLFSPAEMGSHLRQRPGTCRPPRYARAS